MIMIMMIIMIMIMVIQPLTYYKLPARNLSPPPLKKNVGQEARVAT